ncbi:MAG: lytic transglycosylase domain-containing protein [Gammaproteobacteria bacterium]|jgi:soluble lytic murein transglycosylase-like protein|nr:lytic transglycosylase domain-containing protein [Gammaproteobacteria bacterium]
MKKLTLVFSSTLALLTLSVFINVFQYNHTQRLEEQVFLKEFEAQTIHYVLDQEEEQLQAMTQEVMAIAGIDNELKAQNYANIFIEAARNYDLNPRLLLLLTLIESRFDPQAVSSKGALGMTQVMPQIWLTRIEFISDRKDLMDPFLNIHAGAHVLRHYLDRAKGNVKLALLMYNRGEGAVNRDILKGRDPSNGYAQKVLFSDENERRRKSSRAASDGDDQTG